MVIKYICERCNKRIRFWQSIVYDERIVSTGKNGDVTPYHYKEHIKHKSCLSEFEKRLLEKRKKKKDDNDTNNKDYIYSS